MSDGESREPRPAGGEVRVPITVPPRRAAEQPLDDAGSAPSGSPSRDPPPDLASEEEEQVPYPALAPTAFFCLKQTTRPRSWCLRLVCNPYPFPEGHLNPHRPHPTLGTLSRYPECSTSVLHPDAQGCLEPRGPCGSLSALPWFPFPGEGCGSAPPRCKSGTRGCVSCPPHVQPTALGGNTVSCGTGQWDEVLRCHRDGDSTELPPAERGEALQLRFSPSRGGRKRSL